MEENKQNSWLDWRLLCCGCLALAVLLIGATFFGIFNYKYKAESPSYTLESSGGGSLISGGQNIQEDCIKKYLESHGFARIIKNNGDSVDDYIKYIRDAAQQYGISPGLIIAVISQESGFNKDARSPVGAIGLMQVMPSTAKQMGYSELDMTDPQKNILAGTKYLKYLNTEGLEKNLRGNLENVIASYNAGPGAVNKYGGVPPYKETKNYVVRVRSFYEELINSGCVEGFAVMIAEGIHPNHQKLINNLPHWKGYGDGGDCFGSLRKLITTLSGFNFSPFTSLDTNYPDSRSLVPTTEDLNRLSGLLSKGYIVLWQVNGDHSGQHWIVPVKVDKRNDGYYLTYIDSAPVFEHQNRLVTQRIDRFGPNKGWVYLGRVPRYQGSDAGLRGIYIVPK